MTTESLERFAHPITALAMAVVVDLGTYQLDWDNRSPSVDPYQIAISVTSSDARLMNALWQNLGTKAPYFFAGNRLTYVLIDEFGNW